MFELQAKVKARDLRGKKKDELMKQANELKQVWWWYSRLGHIILDSVQWTYPMVLANKTARNLLKYQTLRIVPSNNRTRLVDEMEPLWYSVTDVLNHWVLTVLTDILMQDVLFIGNQAYCI